MSTPETVNTLDGAVYNPPPKTQSKPAKSSVCVSQTQRKKVDSLDDGCCVVTNIWKPSASLRYVRIVSTTTPHEDLRRMEIIWGVPQGELDLSSPRNVVHLSCSWHIAFDRGDWALVPTLIELVDISLRFLEATETKKTVHPSLPEMLQSSERTKYCLVFFKPLAGHVYHRATNKAQTEFEKITVDQTGISPPFENHCHPYFAAWNAISKFRKHEAKLSWEQTILHGRLELLMNDWMTYLAQVKDKKLGFPKKIDDDQHLPERQQLLPTPPTSSSLEESKEWFCYADWSHVTTWLANVAEECDPVKEQSVEWPVDEITRSPTDKYVPLEEWPIPPDTSKFSSTNWAKWIHGITLTRPAPSD